MRKEQYDPILSCRIDAGLVKRIDDLVAETGMTRAAIVERCLCVGLVDEEEFVAWCRSPIKGPMLEMLTRPKIMAIVSKLMGQHLQSDETQLGVLKAVSENRRKRGGKLKPDAA